MTKPTTTPGKEAAPSFVELILTMNTVTYASEYMAGTVLECPSKNSKRKPELPSKSVVKSLPDTKSKMDHGLADLCVMTKPQVEAIAEYKFIKCTSALQSQILKAVGFSFEEALQAVYY